MVRISKIPVYDDDFDHLADQAFTSPEKKKKTLWQQHDAAEFPAQGLLKKKVTLDSTKLGLVTSGYGMEASKWHVNVTHSTRLKAPLLFLWKKHKKKTRLQYHHTTVGYFGVFLALNFTPNFQPKT